MSHWTTACNRNIHSGNAYNPRLGNAAYHADFIADTAARFDRASKEDDALGHGLFTYAIVEGLGRDADDYVLTRW